LEKVSSFNQVSPPRTKSGLNVRFPYSHTDQPSLSILNKGKLEASKLSIGTHFQLSKL